MPTPLDASLVVSERSYPPEPSVDRHPFYQVVLPERGRLDMQIAGERGFAGETRFAFIPTGVEHRYWADRPNCFLVLDLSPALLAAAQRDLARPGDLPAEPFPVVGERLAALGSLLRIELARGGLDEPLVAESLGLYVSVLLLQPEPPPVRVSTTGERRLALRTRDFLDASFAAPVSITDIAAAVGASASHTQRSFRAHFGVTIVDYLRSRRLQLARELLRDSDLSITEVAFAAGFSGQSYFTRLFTREVGVPPSRYRTAMRARLGMIPR